MKQASFGRRDLLRAAGLTLLVPSFLREAFAEPEKSGPRLLIFMQANGTHQATFWPDPNTGSSPILEPILGEPSLAERTLLIRGVNNLTTGPGNEHDRGFSSLWTGVPTIGKPDDAFGGGPSIDQILKAALAPKVLFPTLNVGVLAADVAPKNGHRRSFSYIGPRQQIPTQVDPYRVYASLFRTSELEPAQARQQLQLRRSVLDASARDLAALAARLGPNQRQKLDAHTTALREYEARLTASLEGQSNCAKPKAPEAGLDPSLEDNVPRLLELMLDAVAVALACNLTRIVTFPIGMSGNQWFYRWLGINIDNHSDVAHLDADDGSNPAIAEIMTQISRWVAMHVAKLAQQLQAIPEEDGSVLDHSLVVWANENATGFHRLDNVPVVMLGRAGGRLTRSGVFYEGAQSHHQLCTTVLQLMGVQVAGYGDQPGCGPLTGF
ncbi:MAG TPA: DUF1552 domain-containing protein [Polyangiaceae bacterium]|nr:DUF1552 domain-containing protein [Polyangiaceae bacterium]